MTRIALVRRQLAFARHIPLRQIAHRARLVVLRAWEARFGISHRVGDIRLLGAAPGPLLAPRSTNVRRSSQGWSFEFLGRRVDCGAAVDWTAGGRQPDTQLWRMNLHYMEYLEAQPDAEFADLVLQWIAGNPPYAPGVHSDAWNAYALSLRVVVWMQQLPRRPGLPMEVKQRIVDSVGEQLAWLERHLERDIGGNHLFKNIKALIWASCAFESDRAARWRALGIDLLEREIASQFLPDGMQFERSPSYHCQVFVDLLEIRWALGGGPVCGLIDKTLARAAQVIAELVHPDGLVCQFGDSGLTMSYSPAECLHAYARIFGQAPVPSPHFAFACAGYYGARSEGELMVMDVGPLGPDSLPGHAHGDMLAFEWSLGGHRLIVDQGVFEYVAGARRAASRASANHNTLSIAGADQADFYGSFRVGRRGTCKLLNCLVEEDHFEIEAEHDGFTLFGEPVHRRRLVHRAGSLLIEDSLDGRPSGQARIAFLIAPGASVDQRDGGTVRLTCGGQTLLARGSFPIGVEPAVWWPDMGEKQDTVRLVMALPKGAQQAWTEIATTGIDE